MKRRLLALFIIPILALGYLSPGSAQDPDRAGLVVRFGDGAVHTFCISISDENFSGYDLLAGSQLPVEAEANGMGAAVCKIGNEGCPADDCFCDSPPNYWSYWHLDQASQSWVYSPLGSSTYTIQDGFVDGWSWGPGEPPPVRTFDEICSAAAAAPPTATPTNSATPTPTLTATQTAAPTATPTAASTDTPAPTDTPTVEPTHTPRPTETADPAVQVQLSTNTPAPPPTDTAEPSATPPPTATNLPPTDIPQATHTPQPSATPALATPTPEPVPLQPTALQPTAALAKAVSEAQISTPTDVSQFPPKHTLSASAVGAQSATAAAVRTQTSTATPASAPETPPARGALVGVGLLAYLAFGLLVIGLLGGLGFVLLLGRR